MRQELTARCGQGFPGDLLKTTSTTSIHNRLRWRMAQCFKCRTNIDQPREIRKRSLCEHCGAELKVCYNCRFYDPAAHWECRESISEPVREKDRANFCDFFVAGDNGFNRWDGHSPGSDNPTTGARSAFDALFGDGSEGA